jgi:hypothetical protein
LKYGSIYVKQMFDNLKLQFFASNFKFQLDKNWRNFRILPPSLRWAIENESVARDAFLLFLIEEDTILTFSIPIMSNICVTPLFKFNEI